EKSITVEPEIMVPLVGHVTELKEMRQVVIQAAKEVEKETGQTISFTVGTMIEIPRAAVTANEIAKEADFFSFGTNDLTQTSVGCSRDGAEGKLLQTDVENKITPENPLGRRAQNGVGKRVEAGAKLGRSTKQELMLGSCGEHGGEKTAIEFFQQTGLDYVSCSPYRVPLARLAAAQAAIKQKKEAEKSVKAV